MSSEKELELEKIERIMETRIMANLSRDNLDVAIKQSARTLSAYLKEEVIRELEGLITNLESDPVVSHSISISMIQHRIDGLKKEGVRRDEEVETEERV